MKENLITIEVALNGTDENPFHRWALKINPFPMVGRADYDAADRIVRSLGADPIPNTEYIRERLRGFSPEFIELCCRRFKKGKYVRFYITFDADKPRYKGE